MENPHHLEQLNQFKMRKKIREVSLALSIQDEEISK